MPEGTGASFIPKNANRVKKPRTSKRIYIFSYVTYVLFFGTLLAVVGTYVYAGQVERQRDGLQQQLAGESTRFSESDIARIRDLEKRLIAATQLVESANAPSRIFETLESIIVDSVRIVRFGYERQDGTVLLTFASASETFDAAIFQRNLVEAVPGLASTDVVTYTYSESSSQDDDAAYDPSERLIVTFEGSIEASVFPYDPSIRDDVVPASTSTIDAADGSDAATSSSTEIGTSTDDTTQGGQGSTP